MPYYMFRGSYTTDALRAMVQNPQDREAAARGVIEAAGGKLDAFYFAFGKDDVVAIIEAPNDEAVAACALAVGASGALSSGHTTRLLTGAEAKKAMAGAQKAAAAYKPPS